MIIEDPESFKSWLTARLEPLCDADPAALAKYVYALVKKDKPVEELRSSMIGQLEVFLQKETQGFVNLLFKTLETQHYETKTENLPAPAASAPAAPPPSLPNKTANPEFETRNAFIAPSHEEPEKKLAKEPSAAILASAQNSNSLGCALLATAAGRRDSEKHIRKADSDKEDRSRRRIRRGSSVSPDRGRRTRSRSFDRRRSRSRERDRARAWRNKSPPSRGRYDRDRRHTHSKSPIRRYSKSRSPVGNRRTRYRNRSPPRSRSRTRSRSPFASKYSNSDSRERKDGALGISPRGENNVHGDTDLRLPAIPQNIQSVVAVPAEPNFQTRRCRDFDEKGYCMRGDLCPFDHGSDPVILEDVVPLYNGSGGPVTPLLPQPTPPPQLRQPLQPPPVTTNNMAEYNPDAPSMEPRMWTRPQFRPGPMMRGGMMRGGMGMGRGFPHQRELINVVTASATGGPPPFRHSRAPLSQDFNNGRVNIGEKQSFDYNRLGLNRPMRAPFSGQGGNTSLQLKKVPLGVNNITLLNNHFSKFGKIVNIQVSFEGDPESALITFSTHTEANVAYKSTEAVLNNRFIRVFWYNPNNSNSNSINKDNNTTHLTSNITINNNESKQENTPPGGGGRQSVLERLGAPTNKVVNNILPPPPTVVLQQQQEEKVTLANNNLSKTLYIPSAMKKEIASPPTSVVNKELAAGLPNNALKKKIEEVTIAKKKQEEARKAGIKLNADLRKRKQELLEKQINQQKLLIQRMEAKNISTQQKNTLMATIKALQESIEKIRKDLSSSVKANLTKVAKKGTTPKDQVAILRKSKEEVQRELLDAELDLLSSQHEGKDTTEIRKKVLELKQRAVVLGVSSTRGSYRGRRGAVKIRGRGRGRGSLSRLFLPTTTIGVNAYDHNVVDHRPTKILVSGYEQDDKAEVITHFEQYGEILDYISDDATPSLVLNYKARKEAELAILKGRNFNDRLLSVTWATPNTSIRGGIPTKPPTPSHRQVMVMEDEENILAEDTLEDVEDEDEDIGILSPDILIHDDEDEDEEDRSWRR